MIQDIEVQFVDVNDDASEGDELFLWQVGDPRDDEVRVATIFAEHKEHVIAFSSRDAFTVAVPATAHPLLATSDFLAQLANRGSALIIDPHGDDPVSISNESLREMFASIVN